MATKHISKWKLCWGVTCVTSTSPCPDRVTQPHDQGGFTLLILSEVCSLYCEVAWDNSKSKLLETLLRKGKGLQEEISFLHSVSMERTAIKYPHLGALRGLGVLQGRKVGRLNQEAGWWITITCVMGTGARGWRVISQGK